MKKRKQKILKNIEVEDHDIFIRVTPEDSLETKRELLEIKEALIQTQIASEKFKMQRKEEMLRRQDAKRVVREMSMALSKMLSELPKEIKVKIREEKPKVIQARPMPSVELIRPAIPKKEEIRPTKIADLQKELENIKSKLSGMQ